MKPYILRKIIPLFVLIAITTGITQCIVKKHQQSVQKVFYSNQQGKGLQFEIDFEKGKYHNYPLMAIWLETPNGEYIQTLYVARSVGEGVFQHGTVSDKKWLPAELRRPATLPYWAHKRSAALGKSEVYPSKNDPVPDAYTGATPLSDFTLYTKSDEFLKKPFRVMLEINQFFDFNKSWHNNKYPNDEDYKTSGQPALVYTSDLIYPGRLPATLTMTVVGYSHYSGKNGNLYMDDNSITTAKQIVKSITVKVSE